MTSPKQIVVTARNWRSLAKKITGGPEPSLAFTLAKKMLLNPRTNKLQRYHILKSVPEFRELGEEALSFLNLSKKQLWELFERTQLDSVVTEAATHLIRHHKLTEEELCDLVDDLGLEYSDLKNAVVQLAEMSDPDILVCQIEYCPGLPSELRTFLAQVALLKGDSDPEHFYLFLKNDLLEGEWLEALLEKAIDWEWSDVYDEYLESSSKNPRVEEVLLAAKKRYKELWGR